MVKMSDVLERGGRRLASSRGEEAPAPAKARPEKRQAQGKRPGRQPASPKRLAARRPLPAEPKAEAPTDGGSSLDQELSIADWSVVDNERLVSLFAPSSPQAKRIDILRSQLLYPFHGEPPRTVLVTSAVPKEGKTLLATNLAVSFARGLQQYVMVMDCNLLDPGVHDLLQVPRRPGLSDFLEQGATVPEIMHWTKIDKLSVIPAGSPSFRSSELLATDRMVALITELRARYADRYIIMDTPPVQAFDDPSVLARMVEGIIFVALSGSTDREVVVRALGRLPEEKVMGLVLNDKLSAVSDATSVSATSEIEE